MDCISHQDFATYVDAAGVKAQTELNGVTITVCKDGATFIEDRLGNIYQA